MTAAHASFADQPNGDAVGRGNLLICAAGGGWDEGGDGGNGGGGDPDVPPPPAPFPSVELAGTRR